MPTVVISPYHVAGFPEGGGHFWVYIQYVLGLQQSGCEVFWLESLGGNGSPQPSTDALATFRSRLAHFGLEQRCILYRPGSGSDANVAPTDYLDMGRDEAEAIFDRADLLLNFHYNIGTGLLQCFRRTALVDIDPGLLQFWMTRGQLHVPEHDCYFTIAEGVARSNGKIPRTGLRWIPIRPAVCLDQWPSIFTPEAETFTSISIWDSDDWVVDAQETYENTKRVAYLDYAELPSLTSQPLELALFLRTEKDMEEKGQLERLGWRIRQSREVAGSPEAYRKYIQSSRGEFSCAKPSYVKLQTGWISDRTLCYLASGKPAVVQDTGPVSFLPTGEGLFRFSTAEQAAAAFAAVNADYGRHSRAARQIAESGFDARQVVSRILSCAIR